MAPNFEHHLNISAWSAEFPDAMVIGVEGLPEKREKTKRRKGSNLPASSRPRTSTTFPSPLSSMPRFITSLSMLPRIRSWC